MNDVRTHYLQNAAYLILLQQYPHKYCQGSINPLAAELEI
jgi:hypothetical protein